MGHTWYSYAFSYNFTMLLEGGGVPTKIEACSSSNILPPPTSVSVPQGSSVSASVVDGKVVMSGGSTSQSTQVELHWANYTTGIPLLVGNFTSPGGSPSASYFAKLAVQRNSTWDNASSSTLAIGESNSNFNHYPVAYVVNGPVSGNYVPALRNTASANVVGYEGVTIELPQLDAWGWWSNYIEVGDDGLVYYVQNVDNSNGYMTPRRTLIQGMSVSSLLVKVPEKTSQGIIRASNPSNVATPFEITIDYQIRRTQ